MSIDNEYLSKKIEEISAQIGEIEQKIIFDEKNTEIEIGKLKELISKLITLHGNNLKELYDKTLEAQLDKFDVNYKELVIRRQEILEFEYGEKLKLERETVKKELDLQKEFYEKELETLKTWYENEIKKQINELTSWHLNSLEEKLDKQRDSYDKDLKSRLFLQKELLESEYQNKLNMQKFTLEEEANRKLKLEKEEYEEIVAKKLDEQKSCYEKIIEQKLAEQENWYRSNFKLINKNSEVVKFFDNLIDKTKKK